MNDDTIGKNLRVYCENFPFVPIENESIDELAENWGFAVPGLLRRVYRTIGTGDYWLTGQYFVFDLLGDGSRSLKQLLKSTKLHNSKHTLPLDPLLIGEASDLYYFVSGTETETYDPLVYFYCEDGDSDNTASTVPERLSQIIRKLRCFEQPMQIPQSLVDRKWYELRHGFENPFQGVKNHDAIQRWVKKGRPGMEARYLNHFDDSTALHPLAMFDLLECDSVFSPEYVM